MHTQFLALATLITFSQAWVQFPGAAKLEQDPWNPPTPKNIEIQPPVTTHILDASPSAPSISTVPTLTTIPIPANPTASADADAESHIPLHEQFLRWVKRQGGAPVANPGVAQPTAITQVSPVTTLTMMSKGQDIKVVYTQTFAKTALDPWPSPSSGEIGLGTIQGQVGQVKSKREEASVPQTALVTIQTEVPDAERAQDLPERRIAEKRDSSAASNALVTVSAVIAAGGFSLLVAL
jgi:hypothetical protein